MRLYGQVNIKGCDSSGKMAKRHEDDVHNVPRRHKQYRYEHIYQSRKFTNPSLDCHYIF